MRFSFPSIEEEALDTLHQLLTHASRASFCKVAHPPASAAAAFTARVLATLDPAIPLRVHDRKKKNTLHHLPIFLTPAFSSTLGRLRSSHSVDDKIRPDISYLRLDILDQMDQLRMDDRLGPDGEPAPKTDEEYAQAQLTLRAIVSSKEAGVIIGKGGKNVADLRDETGVKAGVSKVVQGVHDRVLTITGGCDAISRAYAIVARALLEGAPAMGMGGVVQSNGTHPIKLLISHNQMGTIIGRQGLKIKHIQDASGVRMVAQKEMLPQSTERIVEVQGTPEGIQRAIWEICKCLVDDWQRGTGTVLYNPVVRTQPSGSGNASGGAGFSQGSGRSDYGGSPRVMRTGNGADFSNGSSRPYNRRSDSDAALRGPPTHDENGEEIQTQNISIPADMVGCIIGRAGSKISEIRKTSGARISIAKAPHDETGERMFTIMGTAKANESALFLLYENLEAEKMRRSQLQEPE
ncbi:hypothetical protein FVER53590_08209 [Fusarium verticillioides]|nr:hypothetical protein FVER53590_08209 [Fusarium verticillioides]